VPYHGSVEARHARDATYFVFYFRVNSTRYGTDANRDAGERGMAVALPPCPLKKGTTGT